MKPKPGVHHNPKIISEAAKVLNRESSSEVSKRLAASILGASGHEKPCQAPKAKNK